MKARVLYVGNKLSSFGFTPTGIDFLGKLLEKNGFQVLYAGDKRNKMARFLSILSRIIRNRREYDVILIDTYSSNAFYFAIAASWCAGIMAKKYVPILRGGDLPSRKFKSPFLTRQFLGHAYEVVSVSRYLQDSFASVCKITFIPNSIDLQQYPFKPRTSIIPTLLWVRSLHNIYNPGMAVRVVAILKKKYPDVRLTMVGPDKDGSKGVIDQLAISLGVSNNVVVAGKLSKTDWIRLSEESGIFINTTNLDNMPVSVVEAMALGLPVVSTNVGGIPFLLKDMVDAHLVPRDDAEAMAAKICDLILNPEESYAMTLRARRKAEEFNETNIAHQWSELLEFR